MRKILNKITDIYITWINLINIFKISNSESSIIFYIETYSEWNFFLNIAEELSKNNFKFIIISSEKNHKNIKNIKNNFFFIGNGSARTFLFRLINVKLFFISLTNIDNLYLKKSIHKIDYVYVFHSIVSSHRIYEDRAFDNYNTIFCVGEHHYKEIKKREKIFQLNKKKLIKFGYPRLENLIRSFELFKNAKRYQSLKVLSNFCSSLKL